MTDMNPEEKIAKLEAEVDALRQRNRQVKEIHQEELMLVSINLQLLLQEDFIQAFQVVELL